MVRTPSQGLGTSEKLQWLAQNQLLPLHAHQAARDELWV